MQLIGTVVNNPVPDSAEVFLIVSLFSSQQKTAMSHLSHISSPKLFLLQSLHTADLQAPGWQRRGTPGTQEGVPFPRSRGAGAQRLAALPSRGRMLPGWSTLRITRSRRCDQTFQQLGPTVLAMHLAIICWRRRPAPCSCDWLAAPGQGRIGLSRPHSLLWLLLLSKPSKEIIPCFIDNL